MNKNYLMMFLLVNANFKSERFEKIIVERGQYVFSYDGLSRDCGMPLQTLRTTLKDLVETNQITIKSTRKWSLLTICEYDSWQIQDNENNTQLVTQTGTQVVTQMDNNIINEEIDNKDNKKIKEEKDSKDSKKKKEELDFSIVAPEFIETVNLWIQYKKERKESYKPSGFVKMYAKLVKLSGNNPHKALKIIEQSMANNWSGFFQLKQESLPLGFIQKDEGNEKYEKAETW